MDQLLPAADSISMQLCRRPTTIRQQPPVSSRHGVSVASSARDQIELLCCHYGPPAKRACRPVLVQWDLHVYELCLGSRRNSCCMWFVPWISLRVFRKCSSKSWIPSSTFFFLSNNTQFYMKLTCRRNSRCAWCIAKQSQVSRSTRAWRLHGIQERCLSPFYKASMKSPFYPWLILLNFWYFLYVG